MNDKPTVEEISKLANPKKLVQGYASSIVIEPANQETVDKAIELGLLPGDAQLVESIDDFMTATVRNMNEEEKEPRLRKMAVADDKIAIVDVDAQEIVSAVENTMTTEKHIAGFEEETPIPTWELDGKTYEKYLFDGYATQILPIIESGETLGHIGVKFHWEKTDPFFEALDMKSERITDFKTQATKTKSRNANIALAKLFREIIVDGFIEEVDEFGNRAKTEMTAKELIADIPQEFQASLVFEFLNALNVERYYKPGTSKLRQLMKPDDGSIFFLCKLGQFAWLMEFSVPNMDERRAYETKIVIQEQTSDDKSSKTITTIDNKYKRRFATEHFLNVTGISLETEGQDFDVSVSNHKQKFRAFFPATWWVVLADKLAMCFDKTGK